MKSKSILGLKYILQIRKGMKFIMKKLVCMTISFFLVLSMLSGCQNLKPTENNSKLEIQYELTFDSLRNELNDQRKKDIMEPLAHTIDEYGIIDKENNTDYSEPETVKFSKPVHFQNKITTEKAIEDVNQLMRILKSSYGAYNYFGGDVKFEKVRERIIARINDTYCQGPNRTYFFYRILKEELAFIDDSHFRIARVNCDFNLKKKNIYYDADKRDFYEDENGFYTVLNDQNWYLSTEDEKYLHLTVSDNGTLVYGLFLLTEGESPLPNNFSLKSKSGEESNISTIWNITDVGPRTNDVYQVYRYYEKEGIPVSTLNNMSIGFHDIAMTNEFINQAKELRNKKIFILDLRDNKGDVTEIADFFMYNLTGSPCDPKMQTVERYSAMNKHHEEVIKNDKDQSDFSKIDFYNENKELVDSWIDEKKCSNKVEYGETVVLDNKAKWNDYDNTIIVLINNVTSSAAEYFLFKLATLNNVIIMGTNSNGGMVTGNTSDESAEFLSNAGLAVDYGQSLQITDKIDGFDTEGWMPDIITRGDALDTAISLIKNSEK